jgi:serine/threonine-protein kinase
MTETSRHAALHKIPPERWQAVWSIADAALELDSPARTTYIRERCAGDAALEHEVEQFLLACNTVDRPGHVLNSPVHGLLLPLSVDVAHRIAAVRAALRQSLATVLGARYQLGETLGSGGTATVYRAFDTDTSADVAVKVLHPGQSTSLGAARFLREVKITSSLRHANIIPVLDTGMVDELPYYIMPCVTGQTLRELLKRESQLPVPQALAIARDVVAALEEAHAHGIVHRDVKPQNILLDGERALVADFGIARALEAAGGDTLSDSGALLGTPAYMSPEQAAGAKEIDARSDIYSLACVVFEMLAGEPPFTDTGTGSVLAKHLHAPPPDARSMRPSLPTAMDGVLSRALAKLPIDRYATVRAFLVALETAAA